MQSYLQYHRFGKTVRAQHAAAKEKLERAKADVDTRQANHTSLPSPDPLEEKDVEKGDTDSEATLPIDMQRPNTNSTSDHTHASLAPQSQDAESPDDGEEMEDPTERDQDMRRYLSRMSTQRSTGHAMSHAMTGVQIRKRDTKEGGEGNVFIVGYHDENDSLNPHNWSYAIRIWITCMVASIGFVVGVASSIDSMALPQAAEEFGVSEVAEAGATGGSRTHDNRNST